MYINMRRNLFGLVAALLGAIGPVKAFTLDEVEPNDTIATAQNINSNFSIDFDANIGDTVSNTSTTIPHATINGTGDESFDNYSFTVHNAGDKAIFDIDFGSDGLGFVDSFIRLYDSSGILLAQNDDNNTAFGQLGSVSSLDSYLEFTFSAPGNYIIEVGRCCISPVASGASYQLQVSLENAAALFDLFTIDEVEVRYDDDPSKEKFKVEGEFTLDQFGNGIDPLTEEVKVIVGSSSLTIPSGSFVADASEFEFVGTIGDVNVKMEIEELHIDAFKFEVEAEGIDLTNTANPVRIDLSVGDDVGTADIRLEGGLQFEADESN